MSATARQTAVTGTAAAYPRAGIYMGCTFRETAGVASATVRIYDNASAASGILLDTLTVPASGDDFRWYPPSGKWAENGLYVEVTGGTVEGSISVA